MGVDDEEEPSLKEREREKEEDERGKEIRRYTRRGKEEEKDGRDECETKRKKKKGGKREAVISVGRAGCIRSNIMQAHTGSFSLSFMR